MLDSVFAGGAPCRAGGADAGHELARGGLWADDCRFSRRWRDPVVCASKRGRHYEFRLCGSNVCHLAGSVTGVCTGKVKLGLFFGRIRPRQRTAAHAESGSPANRAELGHPPVKPESLQPLRFQAVTTENMPFSTLELPCIDAATGFSALKIPFATVTTAFSTIKNPIVTGATSFLTLVLVAEDPQRGFRATKGSLQTLQRSFWTSKGALQMRQRAFQRSI